MENLSTLKCYFCVTIPDCCNIYECENKHIVCEECYKKVAKKCRCSKLLRKRLNPILQLLENQKEPCKYKALGCTWTFNRNELIDHENEECKFRLFKCIGTTLEIWQCDWVGQPQSIGDHFKENHKSLGEFFTYFTESSVRFHSNTTITEINLLNAFNKVFVFYYLSDYLRKIVYFTVIMIGRKANAKQFFYEFTIKSQSEVRRKIKFTEDIITESCDMKTHLESGKCVALPYSVIKAHLNNGFINFRLVIAKKDDFTKMLRDTRISEDAIEPLRIPNNLHKSIGAKHSNRAFNKRK